MSGIFRSGWLLLAVALTACGPHLEPTIRPAPNLPSAPDVSVVPDAPDAPDTPPVPTTPSSTLSALLDGDLPDDGLLKVHFMDIGQGDAALIQTPGGKTIMVDSGPPRGVKRMLAYMKRQGVERIDMMVNTHAHADHIGGFIKVADLYPVGLVIDSAHAHPSRTYDKMLAYIETKKLPFVVARRGVKIPALEQLVEEDLTIVVLGPEDPLVRGSRSDPNANSIIFHLRYKDISFLFTGDAEAETEDRLLRNAPEALKTTVLKVAHHGSRYASHGPFLRAADPKLAVISASKRNRYGHPAPETVRRLTAGGTVVLVTATSGHVEVSTDGRKMRVITEDRAGKRHIFHPTGGIATPIAAAPATAVPTSTEATEDRLDLNRATAAQLDTLPGVGPATAKAILAWRKANGGFKSVDQLLRVRGIGKGKLKKLIPLVSVSTPKS